MIFDKLFCEKTGRLGTSQKRDIEDLVLTGGGADSDSEAEEENLVPATGKDTIRNGRRSTRAPQQKSIRLTEIGPRMKLQLVKGEEGLYEGAILFHKFIEKTAEEQELLARRALERQMRDAHKEEEEEEEMEKVAGIKERTEANAERKLNRQLSEKGLLDDEDCDEGDDDEDEEEKGEEDVAMGDEREDALPAEHRITFNQPTMADNEDDDISGFGSNMGGKNDMSGTVEFTDSNTQKKKLKEQADKKAGKNKFAKKKKGAKGGGKGKMNVMDKFKKSVKK